MINHIRTLLLNMDGATANGSGLPGDAYVPTDYLAKTLPASIRGVYGVLFPTAGDRLLQHYRLQQYLTLIHGSELDQYTRTSDPRITYMPWDRSFFQRLLPVATVKNLGSDTSPLTIYSSGEPFTSAGPLDYEWVLRVLSATSLSVRSKHTGESTMSYSITDGLSDVLTLPDSPLRFRFPSTLNGYWRVTAMARPALSLEEVLRLAEQALSAEAYTTIFGQAVDTDEPQRTCRNIWGQHPLSIYRLAALTLAMALCIERLER